MDFNELILFFECRSGISSKTGKPYHYYKMYTVVDGIKVYLYCKEKTGRALIERALRENENQIR